MEQETAGLVRRMAEGDSQAFDRLMEFYYPKILRMAYLISGSHADSEDIVQETFVLCWMNRKKIKEPEYFGNWLYKTLTREARAVYSLDLTVPSRQPMMPAISLVDIWLK